MKTRFQQNTSAAYTPNMQRPGGNRGVSGRGVAGLVLAFLLPPVGLFFLWRRGVFRTRGRMLISILSTAEMMAICLLVMPKAELSTQLPSPVTPAAVTAAPEGETLNALSNIEELLYQQQLAQVLAEGGTEEDLMTDEELEQRRLEEEEAIRNTIVYSVYNGARYYHADRICGTQTNGRELTVGEAMQERLGACPNCNPPAITGT